MIREAVALINVLTGNDIFFCEQDIARAIHYLPGIRCQAFAHGNTSSQ
jgi:hypothetical protein